VVSKYLKLTYGEGWIRARRKNKIKKPKIDKS
jgi:hypothetical protein